jgi:hypothetical protein
MSGAGPSLGGLNIWAKRERMCLAILECALEKLRTERNLPELEVDLNRRLYFHLLAAHRELYPTDPVAPSYECNTQPDPDDESRVARENKRPDFQWVYLDQYETDPRRSSKQFVVECKRLGKPRRRDWIFNVNYVKDGICRFRDPMWAYAQRFGSGAMVGYWQTMERTQVLSEINQEAGRNSLPDIVLASASPPNSHRLAHTFERSFLLSPFHLLHLWIDLRR